MWWVYVLELKPDNEGVSKWYVGHTCRLQRRIHDHMTENSVAWVKRWGVRSVVECIRTTEQDALGLEVGKTTELAIKYGIQNVRGGVNNAAGDCPIPHFWRAPVHGLSPHRVRSRSPNLNVEIDEHNDEHTGDD